MTIHKIIEALDEAKVPHETIKYITVNGKAVDLESFFTTLQKEEVGDIVNKSIVIIGTDWYLYYNGDWVVNKLPKIPTENFKGDLKSALFTREGECTFVYMDNRPKPKPKQLK